MKKSTGILFSFTFFLLGIIIGFTFSPVKAGLSIGNNNGNNNGNASTFENGKKFGSSIDENEF